MFEPRLEKEHFAEVFGSAVVEEWQTVPQDEKEATRECLPDHLNVNESNDEHQQYDTNLNEEKTSGIEEEKEPENVERGDTIEVSEDGNQPLILSNREEVTALF